MANITETKATDEIRKQLLALLRGGQAHVSFDDAVKDFPVAQRGILPQGLPYSAWQILEHIRITHRDNLHFCAPPTGCYQPMEWPEGYWPKSAEPPSERSWEVTI